MDRLWFHSTTRAALDSFNGTPEVKPVHRDEQIVYAAGSGIFVARFLWMLGREH
jgi:hypothetical protein